MIQITCDAGQINGIDVVTGDDDAAKRPALPLRAEFELVNAVELQSPTGIPPDAKARKGDCVVQKLYVVSRTQISAERNRALARPHAVAPREIHRSYEEQAKPYTVQIHRNFKPEPRQPTTRGRFRRGSV